MDARRFRRTIRLVFLIATCALSADQNWAQQVEALHAFGPLDPLFSNADGAFPAANLLLSGATLIGTATQGGQGGRGTVFKLGTDGNGFVVLHHFSEPPPGSSTNADGAFPLSGVASDGAALYGTTSSGGAAGNGTVFKVNLDGSGFTLLHVFTATDPNSGVNSDGASPWGGLIVSNGTLYGSASRGGEGGSGTVFKLSTSGAQFVTLHSFGVADTVTFVNDDGAFPLAGLSVAGNVLYGTAYRGGVQGMGTVFRMNLDGTGFVKMHDSDGGPRATLLVVSNTLYGTTDGGGTLGGGTVFKLDADGSNYETLHNFENSQGNGPWAGLTVVSNKLYGTTYQDGDAGQGSVFEITIGDSTFDNLYSFSGAADGRRPQAALVGDNGILYGTASEGGDAGNGTVFMLSISGQATNSELTITKSGNAVILSWPASSGLALQTTSSLVAPITWTAAAPSPTVVSGMNYFTNALSGTQRFFRLQ